MALSRAKTFARPKKTLFNFLVLNKLLDSFLQISTCLCIIRLDELGQTFCSSSGYASLV